MTIALVAALCIGEFFTALIITVFVLAAEVLEGLTVGRGRRAIGDLLDLLPHSACIVKNGATVEVPVAEIRPGDRVLIRPGTRIPVDGQVLSGNSSVEEAAITGESLPADKLAGSRVFAGALNQTGALEVAVESLGRDTTFGRIIEAVESAECGIEFSTTLPSCRRWNGRECARSLTDPSGAPARPCCRRAIRWARPYCLASRQTGSPWAYPADR